MYFNFEQQGILSVLIWCYYISGIGKYTQTTSSRLNAFGISNQRVPKKQFFLFYYPEYKLKLGIDHCRIIDLFQVAESIRRIDVCPNWAQRLSLKYVESWDPFLEGYGAFNIDLPKHLIEIESYFYTLEVVIGVRNSPSAGEIPTT